MATKININSIPSSSLTLDKLSSGITSSLSKADTSIQSGDSISKLSNDAGYLTTSAITSKEESSNKITSLSSGSTDTQYPSAKCVYDDFANKIVTQTESSDEISPNVMNTWGEISALTITLASPSDASRTNEYLLQFTSPSSTATTFSYPSTITWAESNATTISGSVVVPNIETGKTYQVSIVNNKGIIGGF